MLFLLLTISRLTNTLLFFFNDTATTEIYTLSLHDALPISVITVDTEFLRETTYYPLLCVVQMASAEDAVVIDTLAQGIDLKPFFDLMANEKVLKVFHAARQDIEIVWHRVEERLEVHTLSQG